MNDLRKCTKCQKSLEIGCFYKKGSRIDSRCSDCVKALKKKDRRYQRLSKDGNAKRICSLMEVKGSSIEHNITKQKVHQKLLSLFTDKKFILGGRL